MSTEALDPRFIDVDGWPTERAVAAMIAGQAEAIESLESQGQAIADAADAAAERLRRGGRLVYVGAGTSGRVAVQDGVELTPTYNWPHERLVFLMAGGPGALMRSVEGAEDDGEAARREIAAADVALNDVVIGLAASGRTPYTVAAIEAARGLGALTIGVSNNPGTAILTAAEHAILADTGSEIVAGSTRMKAGTAQKAVLNILSTAIMLRLGYVYRGLMVDMRVSNAKLEARAVRMVETLADVDAATAANALAAAGREIRAAVLIASGADVGQAKDMLQQHGNDLRAALAELDKGRAS